MVGVVFMSRIEINGGNKLSGVINVSGAKNSVVALIPAAILCNGKVGFISGRRQSGSFAVKDVNGDFISRGITYKKLWLLEQRTSLMFAVVNR